MNQRNSSTVYSIIAISTDLRCNTIKNLTRKCYIPTQSCFSQLLENVGIMWIALTQTELFVQVAKIQLWLQTRWNAER